MWLARGLMTPAAMVHESLGTVHTRRIHGDYLLDTIEEHRKWQVVMKF